MLRLPEATYGLSLPLAVSTFKANNAVSSLLKLLFLATLYGITLDPLFVLTFIGLRIVLSVATPGLPAGTTMLMFPFYVAVGIPAEAYFLLKAVQSIPDLVFTPLNVTADLSVAVVTTNVTSSRERSEGRHEDLHMIPDPPAVVGDPVAMEVQGGR